MRRKHALLYCLAAAMTFSTVQAQDVVTFTTDFTEATIGDTGVGIDAPVTDGSANNSDGTSAISLTGNGTLEICSADANLWITRDGAPTAWVASPTVAVGETWFAETFVSMTNDTGDNTEWDQAGITFYADADGENPGGDNDAPALLLSDWNAWYVQSAVLTVGAEGVNSPDLETATGAFLRVEITENGDSDDYATFYKLNVADDWTPLGNHTSAADNTRVALLAKSHNNTLDNQQCVEFDYFTIGTIPADTEVILGDVDLSGVVDFGDIGPFIALLSSNAYQAEADIDQNLTVDFADIGPFIDILSGN